LKLGIGASLAVLFLFAVLPTVQAASTTTAAPVSRGYVVYGVQVTGNGVQNTLTVNESVTPSSTASKSILSLSVKATSSNLTYSHLVNSSLTVFPYLPAITNQNFTYGNKNYTVTAKISQQGTSQVSFQGKSYTLTNYAFSATMASAKGAQTITGTVSAFPSDLVYSVSAKVNATQVAVTLKSTSLSLATAAASPALQATSAGVGLSLAGAAIALSLGIRARQKHRAPQPSKPDHWVD